MALLTKPVLAVLPYIPKSIMRRLAARYIAGETLTEALARLTQLAQLGHPGILDVLGENVHDEREARSVVATYKAASIELARQKLDCYVSVKPTHVGLTLREDLALELYTELAQHLQQLGLFLRVEMEDHPTTDATLRVFTALRAKNPNTGIVLQSRLFRTLKDIDAIPPGPLNVRMVKGIYLEPAAIAHTEPEPIRAAYVECVKKLAARKAFLALGTHDDLLADQCLAVVKQAGYTRDQYEFQVLMGVREELWKKWREAGHRVRVYVPYGPEWRPYSIRRMRKNPQILGHVMRSALRFG
jgi:proline dehydrogenase